MAATASPSRSVSHVDLTRDAFDEALAAHGHSSGEIERLWAELTAHEDAPDGRPWELGLGPVIALYLGLLLVVAACISLLAIYWHGLGGWGVLAVAAGYLAGYVTAGEILRRRDLALPADVLETVAVAWVCLGTYAIEELAGAWPAEDVPGIPRAWTVVGCAGLAAGLVLLVARPSPAAVLPLAAATGFFALNAAERLFGGPLDDLTGVERTGLLLAVGLAWIAAGLWLDATQRRPYAGVAHWCGLLLAGFAIVTLIPKTVPGFALVGVLGALSLFFSAFVRHWSFTVVGALGVLLATTSSLGRLGGVAPLVIAVVGIGLIVVGLRWSRWRESVRVTVLARLPAGVRALLERMAP